MQCFSVSELMISEGLLIIDNGIGIHGQLAHVAHEETIFPSPKLSIIIQDVFVPPFCPNPMFAIYDTDVFQFTGIDTNSNRYKYDAILIAEQDPNSKTALVMWIIKSDGRNNFEKSTSKKIEVIKETSREIPYWQLLMKMKKNSFLTLHSISGDITLTWNGSDLLINKKAK